MTIKEIIKDNIAEFSFYRQGYLYYSIIVEGQKYEFPVDIKDLGDATVVKTHKAITLMRYIRKAVDGGTFVKAK
jgi:hypothetical protein